MNYALNKGIKNWIRRWRHTRGYGVHSPLAFRIVKECIRPDGRYGFYCDPYLDFEYHGDRRGLRRARLIIRLLHLLRPACVWMPAADKRILTAIKMIMPAMRVATHREFPKDTDFIIASGLADPTRLWNKMDSQKECGMLIFGPTARISEGVTLELESKDFRILLRKKGMHILKYEV